MSEQIVFTDEFIAEMNHKYEHLRWYEQPAIYFYSTLDEWKELRSEIEGLVNSLPINSDLNNVVSRLRSEEQFRETYHELVVGDLLQRLGYQIEYEKDVAGNLTPDWYAHSRIDTPPFAVEVFTANPPKKFTEAWKRWRYLRFLLEEISGSASVNVSYRDKEIAPTFEESNKMAEDIKQWLLIKPKIGAKKRVNNLVFEVREYTERLEKIIVLGPAMSMFIDSNRLKVNIHKNKAKKYKVLKDHRIPLVIAIVPIASSGFSTFSLENVLLGHEAIKIDIDETSGEPMLGDTVRKNNGLFNGVSPTDSVLSAVLWIPKRLNQPLSLDDILVYHNPSASHRLPPNTFIPPK